MKPTNVEIEERPVDEPPAARRFQFSLLGYLTAITLISITLGPVLNKAGIAALPEFLFFAMIVGWLIVTAHWFADWIITPPDGRPSLFTTIWFWNCFGCALLGARLFNIVEMFDPRDSESPDLPYPDVLLNTCLIVAIGLCFFMALRRWRRARAV